MIFIYHIRMEPFLLLEIQTPGYFREPVRMAGFDTQGPVESFQRLVLSKADLVGWCDDFRKL